MGKKNTSENIDEKSLLASIYAKKNPVGSTAPKIHRQVPAVNDAGDEESKEPPLSKEQVSRRRRKEQNRKIIKRPFSGRRNSKPAF